MRKQLLIISLLFFSCDLIFSQDFKLGIQSGASLNFQTVNSKIRNSITKQIEYRGLGQDYDMGLCYNLGLTLETDITKRISADLSLEYMLKRVRVNYKPEGHPEKNRYLFDLDYSYLKIPVVFKVEKTEHFFYDLGLVNNFLISYQKDKLFQTLMEQNIKEINSYSLGFIAGMGFSAYNNFDVFIHGETDLTPFLTTSDYGGDRYYPFRFHNITIGLRYWLYNNTKD